MKLALEMFLALGLMLSAGFGTAHAANDNKIKLKLMTKKSVIGSDGCGFGLWQRNRDPNRDKYAYVFYLNIHDANLMPPVIKIGEKRHELERVNLGNINVTATDAYQVYRTADKKITLLLEIFKTRQNGDNFEIDKAQLTFVQIGKLPFRMNVKGRMGCDYPDDEPVASAAPAKRAASPSLDPNAVRLGREVSYRSFRKVPRHILQQVRNIREACDIDNGPEFASRYAISNAMSLWQLPCALYASNASSVFITALNDSKLANTLEVPDRPGKGSGEPGYDIMNAVLDPSNATITSMNINAAGNCGSYQRYQLVVAEGEAIEIKLLEARGKTQCSGPPIEPKNLPLLYRAN